MTSNQERAAPAQPAEAQGAVAVEPVATLLDDLEDLAGLAREYDYHKANSLEERIAASLTTLSERLAEVERERDEARAFVLEFRGIVTDEMVDRALDAAEYIPNADNRKWMRAALEAANVCESCASVADHWRKRAESAEQERDELRAKLAEAPDPRHFEILVEAMAEVKATSDGESDQPIADIVAGCLAEIEALPDRRARAFRDATSEGEAI